MKSTVAGEVDESFACDVLGVVGFCDSKPEIDGRLMHVAEDGFRVLRGDNVGRIVPHIVEP